MKATMSIGGEISAADLEKLITVLVEHAGHLEFTDAEDAQWGYSIAESAALKPDAPEDERETRLRAAFGEALREASDTGWRLILLDREDSGSDFDYIAGEIKGFVDYRCRVFGFDDDSASISVRPLHAEPGHVFLNPNGNLTIAIEDDASLLDAETLLADAKEAIRLFNHKPPLKILP
jgi:hypothetical protein